MKTDHFGSDLNSCEFKSLFSKLIKLYQKFFYKTKSVYFQCKKTRFATIHGVGVEPLGSSPPSWIGRIKTTDNPFARCEVFSDSWRVNSKHGSVGRNLVGYFQWFAGFAASVSRHHQGRSRLLHE